MLLIFFWFDTFFTFISNIVLSEGILTNAHVFCAYMWKILLEHVSLAHCHLYYYSKPVEPERLFDCLPNSMRPSSGSPGHEGDSSGKNHSSDPTEAVVYTPPALIPPRILPLLHDLALQMVEAGNQQQLLKIYR